MSQEFLIFALLAAMAVAAWLFIIIVVASFLTAGYRAFLRWRNKRIANLNSEQAEYESS